MSRLGLRIHVVTEDAAASTDPRFATVTLLRPGSTTAELAEATEQSMRENVARCALTFQETDIVAVGEANIRAGVAWARPATDRIARDKSRQRRHMAAHGIPSPGFLEVGDAAPTLAALTDLAGPWIFKPTRGARSSHVALARTMRRSEPRYRASVRWRFRD